MVSLPDSTFIKRMLGKLEFFACVDFFLSETARFADVVLPGSQHEEDEGVVCSTEGRVIKINQAVQPPGDARQDWRILQDIAKALGRERGFTFYVSPEMEYFYFRSATEPVPLDQASYFDLTPSDEASTLNSQSVIRYRGGVAGALNRSVSGEAIANSSLLSTIEKSFG